MLKAFAVRKISRMLDINTNFTIFLPTGADVALETIFKELEIKDEDGYTVKIVYDHLVAMAQAVIPILGWFWYLCWYIRYKIIFYTYIVPLVYNDCNEWMRLLYTIIPIVLYIRILVSKED